MTEYYTHKWRIREYVKLISADRDKAKREAAETILLDLNKLKKQRCPYCQGYGHSGKDCPTDRKLAPLRNGTAEMKQVLMAVRKECRTEANMKVESGFCHLMVAKDMKFRNYGGGLVFPEDNEFSKKTRNL